MGRLFDASISEVSGDANGAVAVDATQQQTSAQNEYYASRFAIGSSAQRINEGLAFSGSPCSVASIQYTQGATAVTSYLHFISDQQLLITADGSVELVR